VTELWALILDHGYEGREFRGVYSTEEKAWAAHGRSERYSAAMVVPIQVDAPAVDVGFEAALLRDRA
jgi:hypothetical protein